QVQRFLHVAAVPPALGVAALTLGVAALVPVEPAGEIGSIRAITHVTNQNLTLYRWSSGIRTGVALMALAFAVIGILMLMGRRPTLTVEVADFESDDRIDQLEAAAIASRPAPRTWQSTLLGAGLIVSLIALALDVASFTYAMTAHLPSNGAGF
ncbi:MAG TPA: hypothetical protein VHC43_05800, partial [Mycobacteriales bacterium]|nr:hypothetical protein [Mycobacteriales bacterium]